MESSTIATVKHLWETWDIRVLMLVSLLIQGILTSISPFRKRWANGLLNFGMWLLYLSADAVALYTIGLISSGQGDDPCKCKGQGILRKADLLAFWAPFLLLHLGGPDTVTALALEDNELWHRHALQLVTQVVVTIYVFIRSFHRNSLWLPTVLMFFDGCIKYTERTCALYFASMDNFKATERSRREAVPNYARLMEEYSAALTACIPTEIAVTEDNSADDHRIQIQDLGGSIETTTATTATGAGASAFESEQMEESMVLDAFQFYLKFKGLLLADSFMNLKDHDESRDFFLKKSAQEALRIVEIELNFIYDVFYTKVFLLYRKRSYARIFCFLSVIGSLLFFFFKDKSDYHSIDIGITFTLLWGALALDIIAALMFVWSDWWIVISSWDIRLLKSMASHLKCLRRWPRNQLHFHKRWSKSISQYNFLTRCLNNLPSCFKFVHIRKIEDLFIDWKFVKTSKVEDQLWNFIVEELQKKARRVASTNEGTIEVCSARGNLIFEDDYCLISEKLRPWTIDVDYDESVLVWHLATDLCYHTSSDPDKEQIYCKFSKKLSDYMGYLLLRREPLVPKVVEASDIQFVDTCDEGKRFIHNRLQGAKCNEKQFCENVLQVKAEVRPIAVKRDKSKSVLFDAACLVNQLKMFPDKQWEITFKVWMEMLCYAAVRCSPIMHVAQLSKGGELVTIVWLLMAHLGFCERFRQNPGFGWTKLVIHK